MSDKLGGTSVVCNSSKEIKEILILVNFRTKISAAFRSYISTLLVLFSSIVFEYLHAESRRVAFYSEL